MKTQVQNTYGAEKYFLNACIVCLAAISESGRGSTSAET